MLILTIQSNWSAGEFNPAVPARRTNDSPSFWKALKDKVGQWKIFVHIDAPGQRIHGDHYPVEGLFPSQNWRKGDIIHDVHRMKVKRTIAPAVFTVYTGWYQGKKRLPIKSGPKDKDNRARLGAIRIR